MKKTVYILMTCFLVPSVLFISGCNEDNLYHPENPTNLDNSIPDPNGTVSVDMQYWDNGATEVTPDGCRGYFYIGSDDNFHGSDLWKDDNFRVPDCEFATIGAMKGIGNITQIPASGWREEVSVIQGYGYMGANSQVDYGALYNSTGVTYFRIYVEDCIVNISGIVIGAKVKYHSPFYVKPDASAITVSQTAVNFSYYGSEYYGQEISFSPYLTTWTARTSTSWCYVLVNAIDRFIIYAESNNSASPRTASVTLKIEGLPDKTIQVTQEGR